nr:mucin-2-like [Rhipicephalus microplus]
MQGPRFTPAVPESPCGPPGTTKTCAAPASPEPLPTRVQLDCTLQVTHEPRPTGGLRGPPTRMATPFELPSSGPASARATNSSRMQVLTSRSATRTTERGSPSRDRDLDSDLTSGSGMGDPPANEGKRPGSFDETTTRSTETESSDIETGSAQSSPPPKPPPPSASRDDCGNALTMAEAYPESNEQGEALLALSHTPINVLAPMTSLDLEARHPRPSRQRRPHKK